MNWSDLSMSQRSELMSIYLKNGITSLDEMKKHYNSFAEGGFTSPSYPPFNNTPQRTDINDNEKRARGKWHVENAKGNQQSIITKAFNEAKSKGLTTEQAYEYVADVAKQHGWSKEGSIVGERTISYKASPSITSSDNNTSPKYITSEPMSEEEYQRRKAQQSIKQSQETGNPDVIYDSDEKIKRDNPNNPRTPFEPHPITPKEMDVTLKGLRFLQPFDPTGLTGVPDFLNSVASGENVGMNFVGMLPAVGKVKAVNNGTRLARFNNRLTDTGEEVLGNLIGRVSPRAGNFINTATSAVQDITSKPAEEIVKLLMQKRGTQAANRFVTGWNLGATTANFGRAGEDVYDFFTEDPLVQRVKEGFQFVEGGNINNPPPEEYEKYKYGIPTAEETDNRLYQSSFGTMLPEVKVVAKGDSRKVNNDYYKAHSRARADLQSRVADRTDYEGLNPINLFEYAPVVGDALDATHIANDAFNKNYLSAGIGAGMFLLPNIIEKPLKKLIKRGIRGVTNALDGDLSSPFSQKNTTELLKRMMWDTYLANPTKSSVLSPVSSKAVTEVDFPESSFNYYENSVFPRMLKDPDRVAITSNGSEGRESIMLEDMRGIFEKKPYAGDEEFWDAYNAYRNNEGRAIGLYSPLGDNIFINSHESLGKTNSSLDHELRHRLQQYMPRTDSENKRLKLAYEDTDGIIPDYDMSNEWETMNLDGRQALIGNSNRDIKNQNSLLELTSEDDAYTINKLYNADGYWKRYIDKLTKDFDGPIEEWAKTFEGRRKIHNWIQAMKYVGILSLPLIPSDDNSYAKGGKLDIPPYTQFLNTLTPRRFDTGGPLMVLPSENSIIGGLLPFRPRPRVNKVLNLDVEQNLINKSIEIANNTSEEKKRKAIEKDLQKVPKERIKDLQRALADKGYYDTNYRGNTKKLQETLVEKGYLDNSNGKEIDGIYGPKTHEAYIKYNRDKQVDGVIGNKTKEAYYNYKYGDNAPLSKLLPKGEAGKCAAFVSKLYDNVYSNGKQAGVYGNAWNMLHNIELSGGNVLFNIYTDNTFKSLKNSKDLINKTNNYLDTHKLDYTSLSSGDVVGIYIQSSNHHSDVLKTGDTYNTHVGYVIGKDKDGVPLIQHTINGKILKERIDSLSGSMWGHRATVVAAARPKKTGVGAKSLIWENKKSHKKPTYNPYTKENPAVKGETNIKRDARIKNYLNGLEGAKENIAQLFPDADLDLVENISIAILKRETGYMRKTKETSRANKRSDKVHKLLGTPEESISQNGVAKLKFASFSPVDRKILGLTEPKQLNDPAIAARCVMYLLARNNDSLNRYAKKYNNLTPEEIRDATILSYNQGMQKLRQLGFNDYGDSISTEWLTELENPKNIQKTTNKIGKGLQKLGLESIANWDIFKDENIPYIAATIQEMNKIKSV